MGRISKYCNQFAALESHAGRDGFGRPTFAPPRNIRVRKEPAAGVRKTATGVDVGVETYYMTDVTVTVQDRIDGSPVRRVREIIDKAGKRIGCEIWV